ncbi:carbohydrate ABC transporter permease [Lacisediminihabitans changchengi]|uniref:Carbohydrate ABC transporter permease n=1 Tax=Lacisediminihabitans changchengi TaxID=2787634 RepID=A0A934ST09_9MICO|nr:carbohydrate ABC transporter permease [Lacisediminihabitans changchengi]MBK4348458.1 carbohydrate ABC transporter permease [Lacisediminihabitans changchengi]
MTGMITTTVIRSGRTPGSRLRGLLAVAFKYGTLIGAAALTIIPLVVVLFVSLKSHSEYLSTTAITPPANWLNFSNYVSAFVEGGMLQGFVNTTFILLISLAGTILIGTMTAYALDRFEFRGKKIVFGLFLVATLVPGVTTQVATFQIVNGLNLFNTPWAAIVLFLGTDIVSIYIFIQFMQSIPKSIDEAAMLDGASRWGIYLRIILPLLRPAIATVVIIKGIAIYNEFYIPFLYMPSQDLGVISTTLFRFQGPMGAQWEIIGAGTLIVILPSLIVFVALQRFIYAGITSGASK